MKTFLHSLLLMGSTLLGACSANKPEVNTIPGRDFNLKMTTLVQHSADREGAPGYRSSKIPQLEALQKQGVNFPGTGDDYPFRKHKTPEQWRELDQTLRALFAAEAEHPLISGSEQVFAARFLDRYLLKQPATTETVTTAIYYTELLVKYQTPEWNVLIDAVHWMSNLAPKPHRNEILTLVKAGAPLDIAYHREDRTRWANVQAKEGDANAMAGYLLSIAEANIKAGELALQRLQSVR